MLAWGLLVTLALIVIGYVIASYILRKPYDEQSIGLTQMVEGDVRTGQVIYLEEWAARANLVGGAEPMGADGLTGDVRTHHGSVSNR